MRLAELLLAMSLATDLGLGQPSSWKVFTVAPIGLHEQILTLIDREAEFARKGQPARIIAKMNSLVAAEVIKAVYRASQAGVRIDLLGSFVL